MIIVPQVKTDKKFHMSSKVYSTSKNKNGFKSLLIIEPDEILSKGLMIGLIDFFDEIRIAINPADAVDLLRKKEFDVIITALEFNMYDGIEFLRIIRKLNKDATLISVSSGNKKIIYEIIENNMVDKHFEKPFELKKMISYIKEKISNKLKEE